MKPLSLCPITLYEFQATELLTSEVLENVKELTYRKNSHNLISEDIFYHEEMVDWFTECLEIVQKEKYPDLPNLVVTSCWANKNTKYKGHHTHYHPNSIISGIFYLTSHETGETVFEVDDPWYRFDDDLLWYTGQESKSSRSRGTPIKDKNKPVAGKLLLFPSSLYHGVRPLNEMPERYTVSFNTFIKGTLGINQATMVTLNTLSLKELKTQKVTTLEK